MTTTEHFQKIPDFFTTKAECISAIRQKIQTNPRYKMYNQIHFTAGDIDQFEEYRDKSNGVESKFDLSNNLFRDFTLLENWEKYKNQDVHSVDNTFNYLFNKFRKGIFTKIKQGKMRVFLPFANKQFRNDWGNLIKIDPKYGDIGTFIKESLKTTKFQYRPDSISCDPYEWYANNFLLRYESPIHEGDTNHPHLSDMLKTLCSEYIVPDIEFFVNRRDSPMLRRDGYEAYNHIFGKKELILEKSYSPILSMVTSKDFADIPIPTGDDWARVMKWKKYFFKTHERDFEITNLNWDKKKPIAVFRGSNTGAGITIDTNMRLKIAYLSSLNKLDKDGIPYLDAGITEWNTRIRKLENSEYLQFFDPNSVPFKIVQRLKPKEQSQYKYIIHIDGHVSAFRLSLELESGSCLLKVDSEYKLWYDRFLIPYVHFIPIKADLSDIYEKIEWCKSNDVECKKIARNAYDFSQKYLGKKGILDYLQKLFCEIKELQKYSYNLKSFKDIQSMRQKKYIDSISRERCTSLFVPKLDRTYNVLSVISKILKGRDRLDYINAIRKNIKSDVFLCKILDYFLVGKKSSISLLHEAFIGIYCMNELSKEISNFVYTFDYKNDVLYIEHVDGASFESYIKGDDFCYKEFMRILVQIALSLYRAQQVCGFVHCDLTPWNIVLSNRKDKNDYLTPSAIYRISSDKVPIIIDYEKSHVIHNDLHYGISNFLETDTSRDIIDLILTSIGSMAKFEIKDDSILYIANYFHRIGFSHKFESIEDAMKFITYNGKFEKRLSRKKFNIDPLDFVSYMSEKYDLGLEIVEKSSFKLGGLPEILYNCTKTLNKEKQEKYYEKSFEHFNSFSFEQLSQYCYSDIIEYINGVKSEYKNLFNRDVDIKIPELQDFELEYKIEELTESDPNFDFEDVSQFNLILNSCTIYKYYINIQKNNRKSKFLTEINLIKYRDLSARNNTIMTYVKNINQYNEQYKKKNKV